MASAIPMSREELIEQVHRLPWAQTIDLGDGIRTPGEWGNHNPTLWTAFDHIDFKGKKVLDIGCWDGLWTFEAEKRGASEVYATDLISQRNFRQPTFELAQNCLGSRAKYFPRLSVYDVESLGVHDFDVVLFAGVYYHLKDPLKALSSLRRVMKEGGLILVEGAVIDHEAPQAEPPAPAPAKPRLRQRLRNWFRDAPQPPAPAPAPAPPPANDCFARFYYRGHFCGDNSNWWVPTVPCLKQWVECNFFEIERDFGKWNAGGENMRYVVTARAVCRNDPLYCREDDDLREFDRNDYSQEQIL